MNDASKKSLSAQTLQTAMSYYQSGQLPAAEEMYRKVLSDEPENVQVLHMLGIIMGESGHYEEAVALLGQAIEANKNDPLLFFTRGLTFQKWGKPDEALAEFKSAVGLKPDYIEAHSIIGDILKNQGKFGEAEPHYRRVIALKPNHAAAYYALGQVLNKQGKVEEAGQAYQKTIALNPSLAGAYNNLGVILYNQGNFDEAMDMCRRAISLKPDYADAHNNMGKFLQDLGQLEAAAASYRRTLEIDPVYVDAYSNLGNILMELGLLDDAIACHRQALEIKPDDTIAQANLGFSLLMSGMFSEGWQKYESRWEGSTPKRIRPAILLPQWTGQNLRPVDRLLIFCEQGFGDKLQFSRYIPLAAERFANRVLVIADPPLQTLFHRSFPGVEILDAFPADQSAWQWHCPLLSLPLAFGTVLENIPGQTPYLVADPARVAYWKSKIAALDLAARTRKIGVAWKPGKDMKIAKLKALSMKQLAPLLEQSGCTWFSLQKEIDPDSAAWTASGKLIDWTGELNDFDDTAALMMNLDLIISVDTSVVHLAGGLGLPTWLFNRHASDWRWMRGREDSPWYPSIRIFTQEVAGDWDGVVRRMITALSE